MIFGTIEIGEGVLHTHNDSYALTSNTTFSVLRPFRAAGIVVAGSLSAFGMSFQDLLCPNELVGIAIGSAGMFLLGNSIAHLVLVNRELRGSDLSVAVWGTYRHLNHIRRRVAQSVRGAPLTTEQGEDKS